MKTIRISLITFIALFIIQVINSQEKTQYKCSYRLEFLRDTLAMEYFGPETYIVQIGDSITKGFTYQKFYNDSLKANNPKLHKELFNTSVKESIETMRRTGNHYSFELTGFQKNEENIETDIPKIVQKIERKEFIKSKMGITEARITQSEMVRLVIPTENDQTTKHYDYIERYYK